MQTLEPSWTLKLHNLKTSQYLSLSSKVGKFCCPFSVTGVELQQNFSSGNKSFLPADSPLVYFVMFLLSFLGERRPPQRDVKKIYSALFLLHHFILKVHIHSYYFSILNWSSSQKEQHHYLLKFSSCLNIWMPPPSIFHIIILDSEHGGQ